MKRWNFNRKKNFNGRHGIWSRRGFLKGVALSAAVPFSFSAFSLKHNIESAEKSEQLFWGDLHTHTNLSDGNGSPEDNFEIAKSHLDFWAMTDHAYDKTVFDLDYRKMREGRQILNDHWETVQRLCRDYEKPGRFIPILGYEWTNFLYGHHNVYYLHYDEPIRMPATLPELYASLRNVNAIVIPHHTSYPVGICGKDWNYHDERLSPFTEIYSLHGSSEEPEGLKPLLTKGSWMGPGSSGGSVQEGLARGHKFGIIASSDSHGDHPGAYDIGLMGVYSKELSRKAIWGAFQNRRVFGVTGDRISLDFSINSHPMGSVFHGTNKRSIHISAVGWDNIDRIDVIKNNSIFHTFSEPVGRSVSGEKIRFRFFIEWGWDNEKDGDWDGRLMAGHGKILQAIPCFRRNSANRLGKGVKNLTESECQWESRTARLSSSGLARQYADAIAFEVECNKNEVLKFDFNYNGLRQNISLTPTDILRKSVVMYIEKIPSTNNGAYWHHMKSHAKFKIHQGHITDKLTLNLICEDNLPEHPQGKADFYYIRLYQRNGQRAWSSPIWIER